METRDIKHIIMGQHQMDGAGVHLTRVLGNKTIDEFDPFLLLDTFDSKNPTDYIRGFPWHPHRGIETVTYLIDGEIEHGDSLGNSGCISPGECQWMTAGSGILHQEMPKESPHLYGLQLWVNLPKRSKMTQPQYRNINSDSIPVFQNDDFSMKIIGGKYGGKQGATEGDYVKVNLFDVTVFPNKMWTFGLDNNATAFVYVLHGNAVIGEDKRLVSSKMTALLSSGENVKIQSNGDVLRFIFVSGMPLKEPVAWGGPIVMNTKDELNNAFHELEVGTFIKNR